MRLRTISICIFLFFFSSRRRHTRSKRDWSSDVCSSDLQVPGLLLLVTGPGVETCVLMFLFQLTNFISRLSHRTLYELERTLANRVFLDIQIGRASCRERV